jgi:TolB-like protein
MWMVVLLLVQVAWGAPPTLAIADLRNDTGEAAYDAAGPGVASLLLTRFARTGAVRVVERSQLQAVLGELALSRSSAFDADTAVKAGKLVGAQYIVLGSLFAVKLPQLSASVRVVDIETGEVVAAEEVHGDVGPNGEEFFVLVDALSAKIVEALPVQLSASDRIELSQVDIRELEALLKYGRKIDLPADQRPKALWRDKSRDMTEGGARDLWSVYNNDGAAFSASAFAKAIGDEDTLERIREEKASITRSRSSNAAIGYGLTGGGLVVALAALALPELNRDTRTAAMIGGGAASAVGVTWLFGAGLQAGSRAAQLEAPGRYWSPEEADAAIKEHNAGLE